METIRMLNAFVELFVVLAFGLGWLVLEWNGRRLDRARAAREEQERACGKARDASESPAWHAEGQHGLDDT